MSDRHSGGGCLTPCWSGRRSRRRSARNRYASKPSVLDDMNQHTRKIVDQFSKQAIYFARIPGHAEATPLLIDSARVSPHDQVLDVACGAGGVACEAARIAHHVTGIDVTPAMIQQAKTLQSQQALSNVTWHTGDVTQLPFPANNFDVVLTRYSFHHFIDPAGVLAEMVRVCKPNGRVLVADLVLPPEKIAAYDRMEKLRDPTHVGVLTESRLRELFATYGLSNLQCCGYAFDLGLDQLMQASFPNSGNTDHVRDLIVGDLGVDDLGIKVHLRDNAVWFSYPIAMVVGTKEA
ncbi:class I SAM-dependent methyltransferase [Acidobacteria bacterium AH-259-O06]|nr:class I SAM-dependent methyltransferase [Acidobacteria bacterium AH-259-O06]